MKKNVIKKKVTTHAKPDLKGARKVFVLRVTKDGSLKHLFFDSKEKLLKSAESFTKNKIRWNLLKSKSSTPKTTKKSVTPVTASLE